MKTKSDLEQWMSTECVVVLPWSVRKAKRTPGSVGMPVSTHTHTEHTGENDCKEENSKINSGCRLMTQIIRDQNITIQETFILWTVRKQNPLCSSRARFICFHHPSALSLFLIHPSNMFGIILIASAELQSCFTVPPDWASISNQCDITRNPGCPLPSFARTEFMFPLHESRAMLKNVCLQLQIAPLIIALVLLFFSPLSPLKVAEKIFKHNYFYCGRLLEANFTSSAGLLNLSRFCCHIVWKDPLKPPAETNC